MEESKNRQSENFEILDVDFNNIQNQKQLENLIIEYKAIIDRMIKQINDLVTVRDKEEQQKDIILNRMQENKSKNEQKIQHFKDEIFNTNERYENYLRDSTEEKEKAKKAIESQHSLEVNDLNKQIEELEAEYKKLRPVEEKEASYRAEIEEKKKELIVRQYEHHDNMNKEESFQLKENTELESVQHAGLSEVKKNAHHEAIKKVSNEVEKNQDLNLNLKAKLLRLQSELARLKKERNDIVSKRKELKINISINEEELQEYKAVGSLQKAKIKAYKDKIQNIKIHISEEVSKRQAKISDRKKEREGVMKTLRLKLFNLEKEKEELKLKMEKIKTLGETILMQREQVEAFFVMAMDTCRKEVEDYQKKAFKTEKQDKHYGEKVDLEDLLPQDKQKIVTNLYTKLAFSSK